MRAVVLAFALLLAACTAPGAPVAAVEPAAPAAVTEASACADKGGTIRPVCRRQIATCVIAYKDAGKACTDGAQCDGHCLYKDDPPAGAGALTGQCQADSNPCGCRTTLTAGQPTTICVD